MQFDKNGKPLELNDNRMLFAGEEIAQEGGGLKKKLSVTNVWKAHPELYSEFGKYPVI